MSCSSYSEDVPAPAPTLHLSINGTWPWEGAGSCHSMGYWGSEGPRMKWEWIQPDPSCVKINLPHPWRALPCPALASSLSFSPSFLEGSGIWYSTLLEPVSCRSAPAVGACLWLSVDRDPSSRPFACPPALSLHPPPVLGPQGCVLFQVFGLPGSL